MRRLCVAIACVVAIPGLVRAAKPSSAELDERRRWSAVAFEGGAAATQRARDDRPYLKVVENHDVVQKNTRGGRPMRLGQHAFASGLYCHASSRVIVSNLPASAKRFAATIGVDSNEQTSGGRGSIVFVVRAGGKDLFKSEVMHENTPEVVVEVDLAGAGEVELIVTDAGDGITCDQADWADARIVLDDGKSVRLGQLRIEDPSHAPSYPAGPLFSFQLDGKLSRDFIERWAVERARAELDEQRVRHTLTWRQPGNGLVVRCEGVEYLDFPTVEWTVYVKNSGDADSGMIENLRAIDLDFRRDEGGEFLLHHNTGSPYSPKDYEPHETPLKPSQSKRITTSGGRSTNSDLPFFNIEWAGRGAIVALGWPGQWAVEFQRDESKLLRVVAGQELTHFKLHRGEEVRTPLVVMQFYEGDVAHAQNVWRSWMIAHNMPHPAGKIPQPFVAGCSSHQFHEMIQADEASQKLFIDRYLEEMIPIDYWWMDAGWYVNNGDWPNTGTWEVDPKRFPRGLRAITDHAHAKGLKSIVWFEPERVTPGTRLYEDHPQWLLGKDGEQKLLNLGNEDARKWWIDHADALLTSQGIDLYRTDFNIDPLPYWRSNDPPDRQGITEIRYVEGFLAYLDELRRRRPGMLIDTCASGGRRNDLEALRRAVPLLRSDFSMDPVAQQNHTMGIAPWIPFYGTGVDATDPYIFRSQANLCLIDVYDIRDRKLDYNAMRKLHAQWKQVCGYYMKDFYPLSPYPSDNTVWAAWQFHDPDADAGVVHVFRRSGSMYESASLRLRGVDLDRIYQLNDLDTGEARDARGAELAAGFSLPLRQQPASALVIYKAK